MHWKGLCVFLASSQMCFAAPAPEQMDDFIKSNQDFSLALYSQQNKNENLLFSPYSIFSCLSMVYVGAREETATEIQKMLSLGLSQNKTATLSFELNKLLSPKSADAFTLSLANGLWVNKDSFVLSDFRHTLQDDFDAQVDELDFSKSEEAIQVINEWTSNTTQGKIPKLLEANDVDKCTRLVLTNAIFFKGKWLSPFNTQKTSNGDFYPHPNSPVIVPMMEQSGSFSYFENDLFQMVALPFEGLTLKNGEMACLFLLPKEEVPFTEIDPQLTSSNLCSWIQALVPTFTQIKIPRFEFKKRLLLNETLQRMGMQLAFTEKANFSAIDGMRDLLINKVVHEAYFALNEAGVTAAAATAASIGVTSFPTKKTLSFIANRPFLFFIVDMHTQLPLFMGKLIYPL